MAGLHRHRQPGNIDGDRVVLVGDLRGLTEHTPPARQRQEVLDAVADPHDAGVTFDALLAGREDRVAGSPFSSGGAATKHARAAGRTHQALVRMRPVTVPPVMSMNSSPDVAG